MYIKKIIIPDIKLKEDAQEDYSIFNSISWLQIFTPHVNILGIFNDNHNQIGMLYYFKNKKYNIPYIIPPPFTPHNGLIFLKQAKAVNKIYSELKEIEEQIEKYFSQHEKNALIKLVFSHNYKDMQVFIWKQWEVSPAYTYLLPLNSSADALFSNLSSEKRKSIRKAEKDGIKIIRTNDYKLIFELVKSTYARKEKKINNYYLNKILTEFASDDNSFAYVAFNNATPIAGTFCLFDKTNAYYLFGGIDEQHAHHGAGVSCMWNSILHAKQLGLKNFDFEGSMVPDIERYFRDFGGEKTVYFIAKKSPLYLNPLLKKL